MTYSRLLDANGLTAQGLMFLPLEQAIRWARAGYKQGQPYTAPPVVAQPATVSDFMDAVHNAPTPGTVVAPLGSYALPDVLHPPSGRCVRVLPGTEWKLLTVPQAILDLGASKSWAGGFWWPKDVQDTALIGARFTSADTSYAGHNTEEGRNAVYVNGGQDHYLENISTEGCDNGVLVDAIHVTTRNLKTSSGFRKYQTPAAHYSYSAQGSQFTLLDGFDFKVFEMHSLSTGQRSADNVMKHGIGWQLELDDHRAAIPSVQTLFDDLECHRGSAWWNAGGKAIYPHGGVGNVYWNLRQRVNLDPASLVRPFTEPAWLPKVVVIGHQDDVLNPDAPWREMVTVNALEPASLHDWLVARYGVGTTPPAPSLEQAIRAKFVLHGFTEAEADRIMAGLVP